MNSEYLMSKGFSVIENPFENLEVIPESPAVYALSIFRLIDRLRGKTDIVYMGMTKGLRNRMSEYAGKWKKRNGTGHRISDNIKRLNEPLSLLFKLEKNLSAPKKTIEIRLLSAFFQEHHELPAWNRKAPSNILEI